MSIKAALSKPYARLVVADIKKWSSRPITTQKNVFKQLLTVGAETTFGRDHGLSKNTSYQQFKNQVPIRNYEACRDYMERVVAGEPDVLWKGKPIYLCKTSGTTSGVKYIPITRESMPNHIRSARNALLCYIHETGNTNFVNGKMIFLQGSPLLDESGAIPTGRLSGIVANHVPSYLQKNRMPGYATNCLDDWENKVDRIATETLNEDMRLISGIPSWVQMYFDRLLQQSGKSTIGELFPNFSLFVYGGLNYGPYSAKFQNIIGKSIDTIEMYPASEGFIAYQDKQNEPGLLLVLNQGIFYEFVKTNDFFNGNPERITLEDVELDVNYVIILTTNAGLWAYNIGDTVKFVSKTPYRLVVTGRLEHFTSAFGEHVIASEADHAMKTAISKSNAGVIEFHLAPMVDPKEGLPYHEWFVEFDQLPADLVQFKKDLEAAMMEQNIYYRDLITGSVLRPLVLTPVRRNGFIEFMKSQGKLGGQNKVPRLSNDRNVAAELNKLADHNG